MNQKAIQTLFALLRSALSGTSLTAEELNNYSQDLLPGLLQISSHHDVDHLLVFGLKQNQLVPEERRDIEKCIFKAVYRYERIKYEYESLCTALEKAKIQFIPLKGSVIRRHYPQAWMRTSCDIDILVHREDLERTISYLTETNSA